MTSTLLMGCSHIRVALHEYPTCTCWLKPLKLHTSKFVIWLIRQKKIMKTINHNFTRVFIKRLSPTVADSNRINCASNLTTVAEQMMSATSAAFYYFFSNAASKTLNWDHVDSCSEITSKMWRWIAQRDIPRVWSAIQQSSLMAMLRRKTNTEKNYFGLTSVMAALHI